MVAVTDVVRGRMNATRGKISEQVSEFYLRFLYGTQDHLEVTPYLIESGERAKLPVTGSRARKALTRDFISPNIYLESQFGDTLDEAFAPLYFREGKASSKTWEQFNQTLTEIKHATLQGITDRAMQNFRSNTTPLTARDNILSAFDAKTKKLPALAEDANFRATSERLYQEYIDVGVTRFVVKAFPDACHECKEHLEKVYTPDDTEKFPPYHPNCRCVLVPANKNGQPLFPFGSNGGPLLLEANEGSRMFGGREGRPKPPSNEGNAEDYIDYIRRSIYQILLGNYTDEVTALGTLGQIGLGFTGLDFPADIRDVLHDITNWEWTWSHAGKTGLDAIGLIPIVGALKNADEAADLVKGVARHIDELAGAVKHSDELVDAVKHSDELVDAVKHSDELVDAARGGFRHGDEVLESAGSNKLPWDSWKNYEKITVNGQEYAKVGDRLYSKHAVDRMQPSGNRFGPNIYQAGGDYGRSVAPQFVEDAISSVKPTLQPNGNLSYVSGTVEIITNQQGAVVTIMTYR